MATISDYYRSSKRPRDSEHLDSLKRQRLSSPNVTVPDQTQQNSEPDGNDLPQTHGDEKTADQLEKSSLKAHNSLANHQSSQLQDLRREDHVSASIRPTGIVTVGWEANESEAPTINIAQFYQPVYHEPPLLTTHPDLDITPRKAPLGFMPYIPRIKYTINELIRKRLVDAQCKSGFIYVFCRVSDPGFLKIGCTTQDLQRRLSDWKSSCRYSPILLHMVEDVPFCRRVEELIHRDLVDFRREEKTCRHNPDCPSTHTEWFEIGLEDAIRTIEKWTRWMHGVRSYYDVQSRELAVQRQRFLMYTVVKPYTPPEIPAIADLEEAADAEDAKEAEEAEQPVTGDAGSA